MIKGLKELHISEIENAEMTWPNNRGKKIKQAQEKKNKAIK